jgi:catalase-peroxidase
VPKPEWAAPRATSSGGRIASTSTTPSRPFATLDLDALKQDLKAVMTTSQDWWPADWGHYGPLFIRMAWHSAGTYRVSRRARRRRRRPAALRAAQQLARQRQPRQGAAAALARQAEVRRASISWADLMVLAGTVAMEDMGFKTFGFAGGREDDWEPELVYWGPEADMLGPRALRRRRQAAEPARRHADGPDLREPGRPGGNPTRSAAAEQIRVAFGRMAMNDEETVALIAGGHTFGKTHGAHKPGECVGPEPAAAPRSSSRAWAGPTAAARATPRTPSASGLEGAWTAAPTRWTMMYLNNLFNYEWEQTRSPAGAIQWTPKDGAARRHRPRCPREGVSHAPIMFTTDLALKADPAYREISKRFLDNPEEFELAFAKAWFKLTHRDMGPRARYVGDRGARGGAAVAGPGARGRPP